MPDPAYEARYGKGPHYTADAFVLHGNEIILIRRKKDAMWALPGGFKDEAEDYRACALRELHEEAGVNIQNYPHTVVGTPVIFDDPSRDSRSHIITGVIRIYLNPSYARPRLAAGDDADAAVWCSLAGLPQLYADHRQIIEKIMPRPLHTYR